MLMTGAKVSELKNISVAAKKAHWKDGPSTREKRRRGGANVWWKRINQAFDDNLKKMGANPAMVAPVTRWVLYGHLTKTQGMAARRYADIVRGFDRYHANAPRRDAKSADLEPTTNLASDTTIEKHIQNGTIEEYEDKARYAKRQYKRLMKLLDRYADPVTGRNLVKDYLDTLCLSEQEPPSEVRENLAAVLTQVAKEFGLGEKKRKVRAWRG